MTYKLIQCVALHVQLRKWGAYKPALWVIVESLEVVVAQFSRNSWVALTNKFTSSMKTYDNRLSFPTEMHPCKYIPTNKQNTDNPRKLAPITLNDSTVLCMLGQRGWGTYKPIYYTGCYLECSVRAGEGPTKLHTQWVTLHSGLKVMEDLQIHTVYYLACWVYIGTVVCDYLACWVHKG